MPFSQIQIAMLVGPGFEDLEFWAVYMRLKEENAQIKIIGTKADMEYKSKSGGLTAKSELSSAQVSSNDLDVLLVPGGWAPDTLRRDKTLLQLIQDMHIKEKVLGFICHAGWVAASAGIVKGMRCTGSLGIKDDMENAGALWSDEPALCDKNIVWGRVVADIPNYNKLLVDTIRKYN